VKPEQALKRFEAFLRHKGLRMTAQRRTVLNLAWGTHEHFTADQMDAWARSRDASVSRATVYRTLGLLAEGGFLATIDRGHGQTLYEHILGHSHHDHMLCLDCGRIIEFRCEEIEELQLQMAARHHFHIQRHTLRLEGLCARCQTASGFSAPPETEAPAEQPEATEPAPS
jgi:Fur family ferric uptake transcriptional regulator